MHPQLIKAGFLTFVTAQVKARGERAWLLPQVAPGTTGARAWSKWFGRYIGAHGITEETKVFHSFRHTFIDALRAAGSSEELNSALVGHSDGTVHAKCSTSLEHNSRRRDGRPSFLWQFGLAPGYCRRIRQTAALLISVPHSAD